MNQALIKSYTRSIRRGVRTLEEVPEALREEVLVLLEAGETERGL